MKIANRWQAKPALLMTLGLMSAAIAPVLTQGQAIASSITQQSQPYQVSQLFDNARIVIPAGTTLNVEYDEEKDGEEVNKVIVKPDETAALTLTVETDIRTASGTVLIPAGSEITGELQPLEDQVGTKFVADELILPNGREYDLDAVSDPVTRTEVITEDSDPDIIKGAVIGAAAAAVLAEILGSIDILEVLGGGALGALGALIFGGDSEEVEVVVVDPDRDLDVTLQSALRF